MKSIRSYIFVADTTLYDAANILSSRVYIYIFFLLTLFRGWICKANGFYPQRLKLTVFFFYMESFPMISRRFEHGYICSVSKGLM